MTQFDNLDLGSGEFGPEEPEQDLSPTESNNLMAMLVDKHLKENPVKEDLAVDNNMFDVDMRMDIASFYREILKSPLFGTPCEASNIVEKKVRAFVRNELEILVGMKQDNKPVEIIRSPFNPQEEATLKVLAKLNDKELKTLNLILAKVLGASDPKPEPSVNPVVVPAAKPTPTLVPRQVTPPTVTAVKSPEPVVVAPVTAPKRKPGRPPATVQVQDPNTGEMIEMRAPKMRVIKNPNAAPMPTGGALQIAQAMAAQRSIDVQNNSPIATEILGNLGVR